MSCTASWPPPIREWTSPTTPRGTLAKRSRGSSGALPVAPTTRPQSYYIAGLYGLRGDAEKAGRYLRESIAELPALNRVRAGADPDFDAVRSDPAFVEALAVPSPVVSLDTGSRT